MTLEEMTERVRRILACDHRGRGSGITCQDLAQIAGTSQRAVRKAISGLRLAGEPVCGNPRAGYFMARTPEELVETCAFLRSRALHSLKLEARLSKVPLGALVGQLSLDLLAGGARQAEAAAACDEGLRPARLTVPVGDGR